MMANVFRSQVSCSGHGVEPMQIAGTLKGQPRAANCRRFLDCAFIPTAQPQSLRQRARHKTKHADEQTGLETPPQTRSWQTYTRQGFPAVALQPHARRPFKEQLNAALATNCIPAGAPRPCCRTIFQATSRRCKARASSVRCRKIHHPQHKKLNAAISHDVSL